MLNITRDIIHYLNQGGLIMIPLILCSCVMWTLILDRILFFRGLEKKDMALHELVTALDRDHSPDPGRGVNHYLVHLVRRHRTHDPVIDRRIADQCAMTVSKRYDRFLSTIAVLAAVSPLFGLLGTVTGMIETFDVITLFGTGNARAMAGGISEALVTTQGGLMVSIPGLFMSVLLYRWSARSKDRLKEAVMILKRSLK